MRKFVLSFMAVFLIASFATSCLNSDDESDTWEEYADWREANNAWLEEMQELTDEDGSPYYHIVRGVWDNNSYVLMHYFNDTTLTRGNLSPYYTSTIDVVYYGRLYDGTPFDSSYLETSPADSVYRTQLTNVITGWVIAAMDMHVGDTCEFIVPYSYGYGASSSGSILPYSHLVFGMKMVGVPYYEVDD